MPNESAQKASQILGKLSLQMHRRNQQVMSPSQIYLLRDALGQAGRAFKWSKDYGHSEAENDIMTLATAGLEGGLAELARTLMRSLQIKQQLRENIAELRDKMNNDVYPIEITFSYTVLEDGEYVYKEETRIINTRDEAIELLESLEARLDAESDLTEAIISELQSRQQELSRITQSFSAILKAWHDEAVSIISNMRA